MRTLLTLILIATGLSASEPWEPVGNPELRHQEEVTALMRLAYRSTAAGLNGILFSFCPTTCARVGDEVIVRNDDSTTYRVNAVGILESWPISAEETIHAPSPTDRQQASLAVAAALCDELPLTSTTMTAAVDAAGAWNIRWETSTNHGNGLNVTAAKDSVPGVFIWGRSSCRAVYRGGGARNSAAPTGSG